MKTISFLNLKGGVGKTTSSFTVAHMLATKYDKRVLLVDIDPQGNTTSMFTDLDAVEYIKNIFVPNNDAFIPSMQDLLIEKCEPKEVIQATSYKNLDFIPAFLSLAEIEEQLKAMVSTPQQFKLKKQLEKVENDYDYCIIDCSPSLSLLNINALIATNNCYCPMKADLYSVEGMSVARRLIEDTIKPYNPTTNFAGAFFVQWEERIVNKTINDVVKAFLGDKYINIKIRKSKHVDEMSHTHLPLLVSAEKEKVTADYFRLTEYIIKTAK